MTLVVIFPVCSFGGWGLEIDPYGRDDGDLGPHRQLARLDVGIRVEAPVICVLRAGGADERDIAAEGRRDGLVRGARERLIERLRVVDGRLLLHVDRCGPLVCMRKPTCRSTPTSTPLCCSSFHSYRGRTEMKSTTSDSSATPICDHASLSRATVASTASRHAAAESASPVTASTMRISVACTRTSARPSMAM